MLRALFLDLDGPILDVSERYFHVHQDVLMSLGAVSLVSGPAEYWELKRTAQPRATLLKLTVSDTVDEAAFLQEWIKRIESAEYLKFDKVIAGAISALVQLKRRFQLVLVSLRQDQAALQRELRRLEIEDFFSHVLTVAPTKLDSWKVKRNLIASSGLPYMQSWIVGDSEVDILAGKALGMKTVGVLSGIRNLAALREAAPDFIVKDLNHLPFLD